MKVQKNLNVSIRVHLRQMEAVCKTDNADKLNLFELTY